jgi:hypothetical protein
MDMAKQKVSIGDKIEKAQTKVVRGEAWYDAAFTELKQLMENALMNLVARSDRTCDDILTFS